MADQVERVILEADESSALASVNKANAGFDAYEKKGSTAAGNVSRAFEQGGERVIRITDRTRSSVERLVSSVEKQAQAYGKTGVDKLIAQRDQLIARLGNEQRAVEQVTAAYNKMIAAEKAATDAAAKKAAASAAAKSAAERSAANGAFSSSVQSFAQNPVGAARAAALGAAESLGPVGVVLAGVAVAVGSIAFAAFEAAKSLGSYNVEIENAKLRTGLTTKEVSQFGFAAKMVGQDVSVFERMMKGLTTAVGENSEAGVKARTSLKELGVNMRDLDGHARPTGAILLDLSRALNAMPDVIKRDQLAMELFKKAGIEAIPVLMGLAKNVQIANENGFFGPSEKEQKKWDDYNTRITTAETKFDRLIRKAKEWVADQFVPDEDYYSNVAKEMKYYRNSEKRHLGLPTIPLPGAPSSATAAELIGADMARVAGDVAGGNSILERAQQRMAGTPEGLKLAVEKAHKEYQEAFENLGTLSNLRTSSAEREVKNVDALRVKYESLNAVLERQQKLKSAIDEFTKQTERKFVTVGNRLVQTTEFDQHLAGESGKIFEGQLGFINGVRNGATSNLDQEAINAAALLGIRSQLPLFAGGSFRFGAGRKDQDTQAAELMAEQKILMAVQKSEDDRHVAAVERETSLQEQLLKLRTGPGGERREIEDTYRFRLDLAQQIYDIERKDIGDTLAGYKLIEQLDKARITRTQEVAALLHKQTDEIKSTAAGLYETLFTKPAQFGSQLGSTLKGAFLKPITEGLGSVTANLLHPIVFGKDGSGGIAGALHGFFGGGNSGGIGDVKLVDGAVPVVITNIPGAPVAGFSGGSSPAAGTFARLGMVGALASALAMGAPGPTVIGREVLGAGGSTAGLQQLSSGLFRRGPAGSAFDGFTSESNGPGMLDTYHAASAAGLSSPGGVTVNSTPKNYAGFLGTLKGGVANLKDAAGFGSISTDSAGGRWATVGNQSINIDTLGGKLQAFASSRLAKAGLLTGGSMLAQAGLLGSARGQVGGIFEGAAGGALIGTSFMPGIGTAIGAGVGALIGIGEKLAGVESPEHQASRLIQSIYGIQIPYNSGVIREIVSMAQQYGGSISTTIRSSQVRDLLQLYAEATGQKSFLFATQVHSAALIQSGGKLYQGPTYNNGTPYSYASPLPTLGGSAGIIPTTNPYIGGQSMVNHIVLDAQATVNLIATGTAQGIQSNPRAVAQSSLNGGSASSTRLGLAAQTLAPNQITM